MRFQEAAAPSLVGHVWKLQRIQMNDDSQTVPSHPENYTIEFMDDGSVAVQADCNRGRASFATATDNRLTITGVAITRMACPEGSSDTAFLRGLDSANSYFFRDGQLIIELMYDSGSMIFSAH